MPRSGCSGLHGVSPNQNKSQLNASPPYKHNLIGPQKPLRACRGMSDHTHQKLHNQFITLIDMKLQAENQLYTSFSF